MSITSIEYIVAIEAAMEFVWIRKFILGLGIVPTINESIKMFCDNSAALLIANEPGVKRGARHYHRRYHYVRERIELGKINLLKVYTNDNLADPFTKALPKGKLTQHARSMGFLIMEYLVKISKKACILELKRRNMKKLTLTSYTPNPIRRIQVIECEDSGRYQTWSLLQETPDTPYRRHLMRLDFQKPRRAEEVKQSYQFHRKQLAISYTLANTFRKLFKTLSLDKLRSPSFDLLSDLEESFEEEVTETMTETIEKYMSKELRDNTFSGSNHEDADKHIEKVLKIVDLFHEDLKTKFLSKYCPPARTTKKMKEINNSQQEPNKTLYQAWERFNELLMKCAQHYLMKMQEVILFYNGLEVPTQQILNSKGVIPTETVVDAKVAIREMAKYSQKWHNGTSRARGTETSDGLAAIQAQLNNLGCEIKKVNKKVYAAQVGCKQCKGPHYTKDCPLKEEGKTLEEAYYTRFGASFQEGGYRVAALGFYQQNNANPSYKKQRQYMEETLSKFMSESAKRHEENSNMIKEIQASTNAVIRNQGASIKTLAIQIGQVSKILPIRQMKESYRPQFYTHEASHTNDSIPRKEKDPRRFTLPSYINNVCFNNALADLGASVSVIPFSSYLNLGLGELDPIKLIVELAYRTVKYPRRIAENVQVGEVIKEVKSRNDARMVSKIYRYPSDYDHDKKIRINYAYNLKFSCMIDFAVLEDMDAYRDEGMGDVIFGKPFLNDIRIGIKARQFYGMVTIYNGNNEVLGKKVSPTVLRYDMPPRVNNNDKGYRRMMKLTQDEESSDSEDEDEVAKIFRIDTNVFEF
ncbi:hypothetical protein Tco_0033558 [Tanacetum coccineum]